MKRTNLVAVTDLDGVDLAVDTLFHPREDDEPAQLELLVGHARFELTDPEQRGDVLRLVDALRTALAQGECVGWMGEMPQTVTLRGDAGADWELRSADGARTVRTKAER